MNTNIQLGGFETPPEILRLNIEWGVLNGIRESWHLASGRKQPPSYKDCLAYAREVGPELFEHENSQLFVTPESREARQWRQRATSQSRLQGQKVLPHTLVEAELTRIEQEIKVADRDDRDQLYSRRKILTRVLDELKVQRHTENQSMLKDRSVLDKMLPISGNGRGYVEYDLGGGHAIRSRLLHPDPPEHSTGVDLIYEFHDVENERVRIVVIQYKTWDTKQVYISPQERPRVEKQQERLSSTFCENTICDIDPPISGASYRLPYCTAFLRPTDELQKPSDNLKTSGFHIPVCQLKYLWRSIPSKSKSPLESGIKILGEDVESSGISTLTFEEMFNSNKLGSRWFSFAELEELYKAHGVLDNNERIRLHVQAYTLEETA